MLVALVQVAMVGLPADVAAASPTIELDAPLVEVDEDSLARLTGTYADPDGDVVTLSSSIGTVQKETGTSSGTWRWTMRAEDGPAESEVTITADDGAGGTSQATFTFRIRNVLPIARTYGPRYVPLGSASPRYFEWRASDVPIDDVQRSVGCGAGIKVGEGSTTQSDVKYIDCRFPTAGDTLVGVVATDKDGGQTDGRILTTVTSAVRSLADGRVIIDAVANSDPTIDDRIGGALAVADMNDDGYGDVAIGTGAPENYSTPGEVIVVLGRAGPAHLGLGTASGVIRITGDPDDRPGHALANAGDVNGDGIDDLLVGAPWSDSPASGSGAAYLLFGSTSFTDVDLTNLPASRGYRIASSARAHIGREVAGLGDVNGDGLDDLGIGAPGELPLGAGAAYVVYGSPAATDLDLAALPAARGFRISGVAGETGSSIAGGDVNGDGLSDVVVAGRNGWGSRAVVIYGKPTGANVDASAMSGSIGFSLGIGGGLSIDDLAVGDIDGDGFADVAISHARYPQSISTGWPVSVVRGQATNASVEYLSEWPASRLMKIHVHEDERGLRLAAGDWNRDGHDDLVIGSREAAHNGGNAGSAYVILGQASLSTVDLTVLDPRWRRIDADRPYDLAGSGLAVGDVTGDGSVDVVIGAPEFIQQDGQAQGRISVMAGSSAGLPVGDTTKPTATAPRHHLARRGAMVSGRLPVDVAWSGSDAGSGMAHYDVAISTDGGPWTSIDSVTTARLTRSLAYNHTYRFRIRAVDRVGNIGDWQYGTTFRLAGYHDHTSAVRYAGRWSSANSTSYWGSRTHASSAAGASATFTFTGREYVWIAAKGPNRGLARVYVNGVLDATVSLHATTIKTQQVVYGKAWSSSATRTIRIVVLGTSGHPRVDVDGFVTLR
jgi:hypothetical protein